jgi:hypothetical protein
MPQLKTTLFQLIKGMQLANQFRTKIINKTYTLILNFTSI